MTTDAERAGLQAEAVAGALQRARESLGVARERLDAIVALLDSCARDVTKLTDRALDIAGTSRPEQGRDSLRVQRDDYLGAARTLAEDLRQRVVQGQRRLLGRMTENDPVPTTANDELSAAGGALEEAANALGQLEQIGGHDPEATGVLRARVELLRDAVGKSRSVITVAAVKLDNARLDLDWLTREGTLSAADEPRWLAKQVTRAGIQAGAELGKAKDRLANADGRLDTAGRPAALAESESATMAKGLNPTRDDEQRRVVGSSEQDLRNRRGGTDRVADRGSR